MLRCARGVQSSAAFANVLPKYDWVPPECWKIRWRKLRSKPWCLSLINEHLMAMTSDQSYQSEGGWLASEHGRCLEDPPADIINLYQRCRHTIRCESPE